MALTAKKVYAILNKKIQHGGATDEQIQNAITSYLDAHPEYVGATEEQAEQILENKRDIENIQETFATKEEIPESLPASDVYNWAKQPQKPEYTAEEVGALPSGTRTITQQEADQIEINRQNILKTAITNAAEGKTIMVSDSAEMPFVGLKQYGRTTQEKTTGAQLVDVRVFRNSELNGITYEVLEDGGIHIYGKTETYSYIEPIYLSLQPGTYTPGAKEKVEGIHVYLSKRTAGENWSDSESTLTISETDEVRFYIRIDYSTTYDTVVYPMLNAGSASLPWEPYNGGIPSPNPDYPQELVSAGDKGNIGLKVIGKNLIPFPYFEKGHTSNGITYEISEDGKITANGTTDAGTNFNICTKLTLYPGVYTLSGMSNFNGLNLQVYDTIERELLGVLDAGRESSTFAVNKKYTSVLVYLNISYAGSKVSGSAYPMLQFGNGSTTYELYRALQTLLFTTPNGLPGIPVASGGNYTDENGQQWIADYRDWERGVDIKRIKTYVYDGTEKFEKKATDKPWFYYNSMSDIKIDRLTAYVNCTHFQRGMSGWTTEIFGEIMVNMGDIIFSWDSDKTADDFKAMIAEKYASGNPVTVQCILAEPIETPIPPEELAAYHALHTNYPVTTITNDEGCWMEAGYAIDIEGHLEEMVREKVEESKIMIDTETGKKCILGMKNGLLTVWEVIEQ